MPERVLDERAADLEDPLLVAEPGRAAVHLVLELVAGALRDGVELLDEELGDPRQVDRLALDPQTAGVEAGEVEELAGELRQPLDLLAHATEELLLGRLVESSSSRSSRWPPSEKSGVRSSCEAFAMNSRGRARGRRGAAHAVERARELAELVGARVHDRLVEASARDPLGRLLEPADAPREEPRAPVAERERGASAISGRDQRAALDEGDARERVLEELETRTTYLLSRDGLAASAYSSEAGDDTAARSRASRGGLRDGIRPEADDPPAPRRRSSSRASGERLAISKIVTRVFVAEAKRSSARSSSGGLRCPHGRRLATRPLAASSFLESTRRSRSDGTTTR